MNSLKELNKWIRNTQVLTRSLEQFREDITLKLDDHDSTYHNHISKLFYQKFI